MNELVVLVDKNDRETGTMEKLEAHLKGELHRAISVFVFNTKGEMLLQQRAHSKYHSGGLWSNACCSHPRNGEDVHDAANRRLMEEMGLKCDLKKIFSFVYKAAMENDLTEHEFDHVFSGVTDVLPAPNAEEVAGWKYMGKADLLKEIEHNPDHFSAWFKICIEEHLETLFN